MAYEPVAVRADGTNDWLSRSSGAGLSNSTDFTIRFAFKRNGNPATAENFCCLPSSRFILSINTVGRLQLIGRSDGATVNLNVLSPSGTSWADNSWHEVIITRVGTGTPLLSIDAAMHTMAVATNLGTALEFSGDAAGWGVLSTQVGGGKFTGDISDFWFKAGAGFSLAAGENDFHDASGKLKDLGSSGVAEGMTPDIWLHRAVASWHTNDGAIGGFTLNGALEAAPDAPLGAETGPVYELTDYGFFLPDGVGV